MNPVLGGAIIQGASSLFGGLGAQSDARKQREAQQRQWEAEMREQQERFRASHGLDVKKLASDAAGQQYDRQLTDDDRGMARAESNALLPMRQDIVNSLYSKLGGVSHEKPAQAPMPAGGGQIDFSKIPQFTPQADRSGYDQSVNRLQEQAGQPGGGYQAQPTAEQAQLKRKQFIETELRKAQQAGAYEGIKFRAESMPKIMKAIQESAIRQGL